MATEHFCSLISFMSLFLTSPVLSLPFNIGQPHIRMVGGNDMVRPMLEQSLQKAMTTDECTTLDYLSIRFCFIQTPPISILSFHLFFFFLSFHQAVHSQSKPQKKKIKEEYWAQLDTCKMLSVTSLSLSFFPRSCSHVSSFIRDYSVCMCFTPGFLSCPYRYHNNK